MTCVPTGTASESIFGAVSVTLMYGNMWIILAEALMFSGLLGHCFFLGENVKNVFSACKQSCVGCSARAWCMPPVRPGVVLQMVVSPRED